MGIKGKYTDPDTGTVSTRAFMIVGNPVMRAETKQAIIHYRVWNSDTDAWAGKDPLLEGDATMPQAQYDALRAACLDVSEPWVLTQMINPGTRVPDEPPIPTQLPALPESLGEPSPGEFGNALR